MAERPASKAPTRRLRCSSKYSRPLPKRSPALSCASSAAACAFLSHSCPCSVKSSRVSVPVLGVSSTVAAAPAMAPRKNQPRYPAASPPRSSDMIASSLSLVPEPRYKHAERRPEARADAADPAEGRQAVRHADHPRDLEGDVLHAADHAADPIELAVGRLRQRPHVRRQRLDLACQRADLPLHQLQHDLRPGRRPPE